MGSDEVEPVDVPGKFSRVDKKSHLMSMLIGCGIGAFVCSCVLLGVAMATNGAP